MNRQSKIHLLLLSLICIAFVAYKFQQLSLPSNWDEASPYAYAIDYQVKNGLSLLPSGMPSDYSRGHPTLFFFLAATWVKFTGGGIFSSRIFPLLITLLSFITTYKFSSKFFNKEIGLAAVLLLATRAVIVAQSTQLLPEMLLTLLTLFTLYHWLTEKKIWYFICGSLMLLTKEPSVMLILTLSAIDFWKFISEKKYNLKIFYEKVVLTSSPIIIGLLFFIIQKIQNGWFFYPLHVSFLGITTAHDFYAKLITKYFAHLFVYYGGIAFSILTILSIGIFIFRKIKIQQIEKKTILAFGLFAILFLLFSSINFASPRYILCLYPLWYLFGLFFIHKIFSENKKWIFTSLIISLAGFQMYYTQFFRTQGDYDMGYVEGVKTEQQIINWCSQNGYKDSTILAQNILMQNMAGTAPGYITEGNEFTKVSKHLEKETVLCIFTNQEFDAEQDAIPKSKLKLLVKFQNGKSTGEIYKVIN